MIKTKGNEELKQKLIKLNSQTNYPSVTILFPVNQGEFGNGNNSNKLLKDLLREANQKLADSSFKETVDVVKQKLNSLEDSVKFEEDTRGVAIFLSSEHHEIVPLPYPVESKVYVGYGFQVRDLVFAMNRLEEYVVLVLSQKKVQTYRALGEQLTPIEIPDMITSVDDLGTYTDDMRFTHQHTNTGPRNFTHQGAQEENREKIKNFIVKIDHALGTYLVNENLRFVVLGVVQMLGHFNKYSKNLDRLLASVEGGFDYASDRAIGSQVWIEVQKKIAGEKESYLQELEAAVGRQQYVSGISQAWFAAQEGRIKTLIVEKEFHCPAILSDDGFNLDLDIDGKETTPDKLKEDAVDDLIELVLSKGGDIVFLEDGKLKTHQHLAGITRY